VKNTAGDRSEYSCRESNGGYFCSAEMLVGSFWASANLVQPLPVKALAADAAMQQILVKTATEIRAAGSAKPAWISPSLTGLQFCTDPKNTATLRMIFGTSDITLSPRPVRAFSAYSIAQNVKPWAGCTWATASGYPTIAISLLAGGSWAFPGFVPIQPGDFVIGAYAHTTIPGASPAYISNGDGRSEAHLVVGTTVIHVLVSDLGATKNTQALAKFAAARAAD
jgi:hypothetical protein